MPNWLRLDKVREAVEPLLDAGETAHALVATRGGDGWQAGAAAGRAPAAGGLAAALGGAEPRFTYFLLVTSQRLLALRVLSRQWGRRSGLEFGVVYGVPLAQVVSAAPLAPPWYQMSGRSWKVSIGFSDGSSAVVGIGPRGNVPLVTGALGRGGG